MKTLISGRGVDSCMDFSILQLQVVVIVCMSLRPVAPGGGGQCSGEYTGCHQMLVCWKMLIVLLAATEQKGVDWCYLARNQRYYCGVNAVTERGSFPVLQADFSIAECDSRAVKCPRTVGTCCATRFRVTGLWTAPLLLVAYQQHNEGVLCLKTS